MADMIDRNSLNETPDYDAGLLNDFGGGNVEWWQDYLRAEIGRANEFWRDAIDSIAALPAVAPGVRVKPDVIDRLRENINGAEMDMAADAEDAVETGERVDLAPYEVAVDLDDAKTILAAIEPAEAGGVDEAFKDMLSGGIGIMQGGKRISPDDFYASAPDAVEALVKAADEAAEALDYSANEIANLENVLSDYRQNDATAREAASGLRAALAAIRAGGKP
jgi:hypothetical protein